MVSDENDILLIDSQKLRFKKNISGNQAVNRRISNWDKTLLSLDSTYPGGGYAEVWKSFLLFFSPMLELPR